MTCITVLLKSKVYKAQSSVLVLDWTWGLDSDKFLRWKRTLRGETCRHEATLLGRVDYVISSQPDYRLAG